MATYQERSVMDATGDDDAPKQITRCFNTGTFDIYMTKDYDTKKPYPHGITHDLALLYPTAPLRMILGQPRRFLTLLETSNLLYNTPITILAPDSPFKSVVNRNGRTFPARWGGTAGFGFWDSNEVLAGQHDSKKKTTPSKLKK
ncbi:hypothetical protein BJ508DRAFT_364899 [Ascobolus immersus RN42]|uniref:Uncharacterized protein n=1 Tax=Ascobolus immersus RN42 TaxID=1160509 RepID=A0A3N4HSN9_ASCIM|nr:hypothetical protein BJ508DRAFT_364899 [Ascobolus immersus RN42]